MTDEGRLVALASHGDGRHIGGISLEDDAMERNAGGEHLRQMALLERGDATDAEHKLGKFKQLASLLFVARKAMEHAARQTVSITLQDGDKLVLRLTTMNHQGQLHVDRPAHLFLESLKLLLLELTAPIVVETDLTDGEKFEV